MSSGSMHRFVVEQIYQALRTTEDKRRAVLPNTNKWLLAVGSAVPAVALALPFALCSYAYPYPSWRRP